MAGAKHRRDPQPAFEVEVEGNESPHPREAPGLWWPIAAAGGGLLSAAAMWLVVIGLMIAGWTATPDIDLSSLLTTGTRGWLLAYFVEADLAGMKLTLAPLGVTLLIALVVSGMAGFAASMARRAAPEELSQPQRRSLALRSAALLVAVHVLAVMAASFVVATPAQSARALIGSIVVSGTAALVGAARSCEWRPLIDLPDWAHALPRAVAAGVMVVLVSGAVALGVQLVRRGDAIDALHASLAAGGLGGALLVVVQLLWLPNAVIWLASWTLGAGFSLGDGSVISPAANQVGLLPAVPVLAAVPANGPGPQVSWLWLASGLVAGAVAAVVVLRARPRARFDETALVGGLAAVVTAAVIVGLAWLSRGDLGSHRLVSFGPRMLSLAVMAPTLLGLSGVLTGFAVGLLRAPVAATDDCDTLTTQAGQTGQTGESGQTGETGQAGESGQVG